MKWYKAHVNLKGHPKRYRFEESLGTEYGLHYIHLWFSYVAEYAPTGDVTNFSHKEIAKACEWHDDPETFWKALSVGGFLDTAKGGRGGSRTIAHDWFQENARFLKENENKKPTGKPRVTHGLPVLQDKTVQDSTGPTEQKEKPLSADADAKLAIADPYKKEAKELQDYFFSEYERIFKRKLVWGQAKGLQEKAIALLKANGYKEAKRLSENYLASTFITAPTWRGFLSDPDRFNVPMMKTVQGPKSDFENKRGRTEPLGNMAKDLISGMAGHFTAKTPELYPKLPPKPPHVHSFTIPDGVDILGEPLFLCEGCTFRRTKAEIEMKQY